MHFPLIFRLRPVIAGLCVAALPLSACGPSEGGSCTARTFACQDEETALECREAQWVAIPCRGPDGCATAGGRVQCDMALNQPGDGCPLNAEGHVTCKTPELDAILECRGGVLVETTACPGCAGVGDRLTCG